MPVIEQACFGVYRLFKNGNTRYVSRSATHNEKLAVEIAAGLTRGEVIRPDGSVMQVKAYPHIAKRIG